MDTNQPIQLRRDVEASVVPSGMKVTLCRGESAQITQSLGGTYTVLVNGNLFRIEGQDADALGLEVVGPTEPASADPLSREQLEARVWQELRTCYDPEIPVNIVDLGLIYDCQLHPIEAGGYRVDVKMTLTAPGCGMGPVLQQEISNRLLALRDIREANVELVWDPPWNQAMMSEPARLQLGLY